MVGCVRSAWTQDRPMNLIERETHFEFAENGKNYSKTIDRKRINSAIAGVREAVS